MLLLLSVFADGDDVIMFSAQNYGFISCRQWAEGWFG